MQGTSVTEMLSVKRHCGWMERTSALGDNRALPGKLGEYKLELQSPLEANVPLMRSPVAASVSSKSQWQVGVQADSTRQQLFHLRSGKGMVEDEDVIEESV